MKDKLLVVTPSYNKNNKLMPQLYYWIENLKEEYPSLKIISSQENYEHKNKILKAIALFKDCYYQTKYKDKILIFMYPEFVIICALTKLIKKNKIIFWYTHGTVSVKLYIATKIANKILTATNMSLKIKTPKKKVIGHGIPINKKIKLKKTQKKEEIIFLLIGRISPSKRIIETIKEIETLKINKKIKIIIAGKIVNRKYHKLLIKEIERITKKNKNITIKYIGEVNYSKIPEIYSMGDIYINNSDTKSLDKTIVESMIYETYLVGKNITLLEIIPKNIAIYTYYPDLNTMNKLLKIIIENKLYKNKRLIKTLKMVGQHHTLPYFIKRLINEIKGV